MRQSSYEIKSSSRDNIEKDFSVYSKYDVLVSDTLSIPIVENDTSNDGLQSLNHSIFGKSLFWILSIAIAIKDVISRMTGE